MLGHHQAPKKASLRLGIDSPSLRNCNRQMNTTFLKHSLIRCFDDGGAIGGVSHCALNGNICMCYAFAFTLSPIYIRHEHT